MDQTYTSINKSCINNSTSKQLFSFQRQPRFKQKKSKSQSSLIGYYQIPSLFTRKNHGPSFTKFRKKLIFDNQKEDSYKPSPNKYSLPEQILENIKKRKGIIIGCKLKSFTNRSISPSPVEYSHHKTQISNPHKYSFTRSKKKLQYPKDLNTKGIDSPGPKYYNQMKIIEKISSKYKLLQRTKIMKIQQIIKTQIISKRIDNQKEIFNNINNPQKIYINNKFKKSIQPLIPKQKKPEIFKSLNNPGPGQYSQFTQFAKRQKLYETKFKQTKIKRTTKAL